MAAALKKKDYYVGVDCRPQNFLIDNKRYALFHIDSHSFQDVPYTLSHQDDDQDSRRSNSKKIMKMNIPIKGKRIKIELDKFTEFAPSSSLYPALQDLTTNVKQLPFVTCHELLDDIISLSREIIVTELFDTLFVNPSTSNCSVEISVLLVIFRNNVDITKKQVVKYTPIVLDCEEEEEEERCAICLEAGSGTIIRLHCSHQFHEKCITRWFDQSYSCPLCRSDMATAVIQTMFSR